MNTLKQRFSPWYRWSRRGDIGHFGLPGVYAIAITSERIHGRPFSWIPQIRYLGMTVSIAVLKGRLQQFDTTLHGPVRHGGADRVRYKYPDYVKLKNRLYVAVASVQCDVTDVTPANLRRMGEVVCLEYTCLAEYRDRFGDLPWFNDKPRSPKSSKLKID